MSSNIVTPPSVVTHTPKEPDTKCNGKVHGQIDVYCQNVAGHGTDHKGVGRCKFHGGSSPGYKVKVEELLARAEVVTFGLPTEIDPHEALLQELWRTQGHVEWLRIQVAKIDPDYLTEAAGGAGGGIPERKPSVWVQMYNDERQRLRLIAKACVDAGIEDRKVRIAEQQGHMLALVIQCILKELGVANDPDAPRVVRKYLTMANEDQLEDQLKANGSD